MSLRVDFHCNVNFYLVNKIEARYKVLSFFSKKRKVERGSNFTFTCDVSNIAPISLANVNFTHVRT